MNDVGMAGGGGGESGDQGSGRRVEGVSGVRDSGKVCCGW